MAQLLAALATSGCCPWERSTVQNSTVQYRHIRVQSIRVRVHYRQRRCATIVGASQEGAHREGNQSWERVKAARAGKKGEGWQVKAKEGRESRWRGRGGLGRALPRQLWQHWAWCRHTIPVPDAPRCSWGCHCPQQPVAQFATASAEVVPAHHTCLGCPQMLTWLSVSAMASRRSVPRGDQVRCWMPTPAEPGAHQE